MRKGGIESGRGRRKKGGKNVNNASRPKHLSGINSKRTNSVPGTSSSAAGPSGGLVGEEESEDNAQSNVNNNVSVGAGVLATTPAEEPSSGAAVVVDLHREGPLEVSGTSQDTSRPEESEAEPGPDPDARDTGEVAAPERQDSDSLGIKVSR